MANCSDVTVLADAPVVAIVKITSAHILCPFVLVVRLSIKRQRLHSTHQRVMLGIPMSASQGVSRGFHRLSAVVALIVPTLLLAQDKSAVLENCKLKAIALYRPSGEYNRASEYVVTCMIAAGYRIDPTKEFACYGSPTIAECFIPR